MGEEELSRWKNRGKAFVGTSGKKYASVEKEVEWEELWGVKYGGKLDRADRAIGNAE